MSNTIEKTKPADPQLPQDATGRDVALVWIIGLGLIIAAIVGGLVLT